MLLIYEIKKEFSRLTGIKTVNLIILPQKLQTYEKNFTCFISIRFD